MEAVMQMKSALISVALVISSAAILGSSAVQAQDRVTKEGVRLHELCDRGDKPACVQFGMLLNQNRARQVEWRRTHPEFWSFQDNRSERASGGSAENNREGINKPWCGIPYSSSRSCVYETIEQCLADMRPMGGNCEARN
jgi:hypothetical protein